MCASADQSPGMLWTIAVVSCLSVLMSVGCDPGAAETAPGGAEARGGASVEQAAFPLPGPELDEVPGPRIDREHWPEAATWPMRRYDEPVRLAAMLRARVPSAAYQRIARRLRSTLEVRYVKGRDDSRFHLNDRWLWTDEAHANPSRAELETHTLAVAREMLEFDGDSLPFDVLFFPRRSNSYFDDPQMQALVMRYIEAGGVVVVNDNHWPEEDSLFAEVWPAVPSEHNRRHRDGAVATDRPELSGVPLEYVSSHSWMPVAEVAEGAEALATGMTGAMFLRRIGAGALLFAPSGPQSQSIDFAERYSRRYDHDEIWLRAWDQALYTIVRGDAAIPAYSRLSGGEEAAVFGQDHHLPATIVNRAHDGPLTVAVHVTDPQGTVVHATQEVIELDPGSEMEYELRVPVERHWGEGLYPIYLTVADADRQQQFQQSMAFLPVRGMVELSVEPEQRGYPTGETVRLTVDASSHESFTGELRMGVYDFRGRLIHAWDPVTVDLDAQGDELELTWPMEDHGVGIDYYWVKASAVADEATYARAEAKVYKYDRWSMRNEYQWSTWANAAGAPAVVVPIAMRLMAHAGMNALGYPAAHGIHYPAERWGWRIYNEGLGMNTFSPVIEYENEQEIREAYERQSRRTMDQGDLVTSAYVIASAQEEGGFKTGWGRRYYWDEPVAPEKASRAFQWYLRTHYPSLEALNEVWLTDYDRWEDIELTREFSGGRPEIDPDEGWIRPADPPPGARTDVVSPVPYHDTRQFYDWYYDRILEVAVEIFREKTNPTALVMESAPTIGTGASSEVRRAQPNHWNGNQWAAASGGRVQDGPEPGFGLIWGHYDWLTKVEGLFWGFLFTRSGHNNHWVDIPLMFNRDMTHTRASFFMRRWTDRLRGHERIILDSLEFESDIGLLEPNGLHRSALPGNMAVSLRVALAQAGFGMPVITDADRLDDFRLVFAIGRQAMSEREAEALDAYVQNGGTLVFTPHLATDTPLNAPFETTPGQGLAERWGFRVTERPEIDPRRISDRTDRSRFDLGALDESLAGIRARTFNVFKEQVEHTGWERLASYDDGAPAMLTRARGQGRLVFLNAVYQSHSYIQWVTPTGSDRQGFYQLVKHLSAEAGARRLFRLDGDLNAVLHKAVKNFTDATGDIHYVLVRSGGEVPWTAGTMTWLDGAAACYDVLGGERPTLLESEAIELNYRPGEGKLLAFVREPIARVDLDAESSHTAGEPLTLRVSIIGESGAPVPGRFPLELRVRGPEGDMPGLRRSFSAEHGEVVTLNTAAGDPDGTWTVVATDGISGVAGTATIDVTVPEVFAPGFVPWGFPSEMLEPAVISEAEFIERLEALAKLYHSDLPEDGWMIKQHLGYFYEYFPDTRHDILRPLNDVDWPDFADAIRQRVRGGAQLTLTGEDVNIHPGSGLAVHPHHDGRQLQGIVQAMQGADWSIITPDGDTIAAELGEGRLILSRESIDAAGHTNPMALRWHKRWKAQLTVGHRESIDAPSLDTLAQWWAGKQAIAPGRRVITWPKEKVAGRHGYSLGSPPFELTFEVDADASLGDTFELTLPPTGELAEMRFALTTDEAATLNLDVGCTGEIDATVQVRGDRVEMTVTDAASRYLYWAHEHHAGPYRDDNVRRIVPVRVTTDNTTALHVTDVYVAVED